MKIPFACPACGATGSVDASLAGRQGRCKHCRHQFAIPSPDEREPQEYAIAEAVAQPNFENPSAWQGDSAFVAPPGNEPARAPVRKPKRPSAPLTTRREPRITPGAVRALAKWLLRLGLFAIGVLGAIAIFVPRGPLIAACVLIVIGAILVLVGYFAGAYGAFSEDFLYGFFYLVFPIYTAYYIATRWDDLWVWFTCSTVGVGLMIVGAEIARATGIG